MPEFMKEIIEWLRQKMLGVAISFATFIAFVNLISPAWLDFIFNLSMIGVVTLVGRLAKKR